MKTFHGKYRFIIDGRKLVFWENRLGLISKERSTIRDRSGAMVPLPPECCMFLALGLGDDTFHLQASNGEIIAANEGGALIVVSSSPSGNPIYPIPVTPLRFSLTALRAAGSTVKLRFWREYDTTKTWAYVGYERGRAREVDDISGARHVSNITSQNLAGSDWTLEQLGDGVDQMTAGSKKVAHFDFTPAGLAVVDLSGETLSGVEFGRSDLSSAKMVGTVLSNATFNNARLHKANLDQANFSGAMLTKVVFCEASMKATILTDVKGGNCDFSHCDLLTAVSPTPLALTSTEAAPMRFSYARFNYALIGADWKTKVMDWATIRNITNGAKIDASKANLTGVVLSGVTLAAGSKFDDAILRNAALVSARMPLASFKGAFLDGTTTPDLAGADLTGARLQGSSFEDAHCTRTNFSGARLDEAKFIKARLHKANFSNAYLRKVNFSAVEQRGMTGASFNRAFLVGCNFTNSDLSTYQGDVVNLSQAYLHGADFSGANLAGTLLGGAGIAFEEGSLSVRVDSEPATSIPYEATVIDPEDTTTSETTCPIGTKGPCSEAQMQTIDPFPTVWPWPLGATGPKTEKEIQAD